MQEPRITSDDSATGRNPFATCRIRPGARPFLFSEDASAEQLVERLRSNGWWGQIVGPHGSGKSALLATLQPAIERAGRHVSVIELHDGQRRLPTDFCRALDVETPSVLIVDGYEQLGLLGRWKVGRFCRRYGIGLLVTAHASVGLPDLFETKVTACLARKVVEQLLGGAASRVTDEDIGEKLSRHEGDLRETLFDLYDLHERP